MKSKHEVAREVLAPFFTPTQVSHQKNNLSSLPSKANPIVNFLGKKLKQIIFSSSD
jgi:hypothetical protein